MKKSIKNNNNNNKTKKKLCFKNDNQVLLYCNKSKIQLKSFEDEYEKTEAFKKSQRTNNIEKKIIELFKIPFAPSNITPRTDYYNYINTRWIESISLDKKANYIVQVDSFRIVQYNVYNQLEELIKNYIKNNNTKLSKEISNLSKSSHSLLTKAQTLIYINNHIKTYDKLCENKDNLWKFLAILNKNEITAVSSPFVFALNCDAKDSKVYRSHINMPSFSLIDINVYFDDGTDVQYKNKIKTKFNKYVDDLFNFWFGKNHGYNVEDILDIETQLITTLNCNNRIENTEYYNKVHKTDSKSKYGFDWQTFSKELGFKNTPDFFITPSLNYLKCCSELLINEWNKTKFRTYFIYTYIKQISRFNKDSRVILFDFFNNFIQGQEADMTIETFSIFIMSLGFNTFLTNEYLDHYANKDNIEYVKTFASDLLRIYKRIINRNTWLTYKTKQYALKKLEHLKLVIGVPDKLREDPLLSYNPNDVWENITKITKWRSDKLIQLEGKEIIDIPIIDWAQSPPKFISKQSYNVNAFYIPTENTIYIPQAYMQKPFIDLGERGIEYNLAYIGFTISHELSHSLDDTGSKYDYKGNLNDWWTPIDKKRFKEKIKDVITQYEKCAADDGINFDATDSVGESLADISAIAICEEYLQDFQDYHNDVVPIRHLSYRAFFVYVAQSSRQKISKKAINAQLKTNPHPLEKYRVNVPLSRLKLFIATYGIKKGDKMWWPRQDTIW